MSDYEFVELLFATFANLTNIVEYDGEEELIYSYVPVSFPEFMNTVQMDPDLKNMHKTFANNFVVYVTDLACFNKCEYHGTTSKMSQKYEQDFYFDGITESLIFIFNQKQYQKIMNKHDKITRDKMMELCEDCLEYVNSYKETEKMFQKKFIVVKGGKNVKK